jgi:WD40 repeat protein
MVSGGEDGRIIVWDLRKLQLLKVLQGISFNFTIKATPGIVYNTSFLPGGKFLMSSDS